MHDTCVNEHCDVPQILQHLKPLIEKGEIFVRFCILDVTELCLIISKMLKCMFSSLQTESS